MRTTLFRIPHEAFGLPVFGVGLVLAVWLAFSLVVFIWLLRKKGWTSETISFLPVVAIVALAIVFVMPHLEETKQQSDEIIGLPIRGYGLMVLCGVVAGVWVAIARGRRVGLSPDTILSLAFWVFIAGMLGARMFFVFQNWEDFRRDGVWAWIKAVANLTEGGLVVYGGFIGALLAGIVFLRLRKIKLLAMADLAAPAMALGLALGRIGCLLNGCCFGGVCEVDNPFHSIAVTFPREHDLRKSEDLLVEARDNSPPYAHQRQMGLLHGIRLKSDEQGRPVVAEIHENHRHDLSASISQLQVGDRIVGINGVPVKTLEAAHRQLSLSPAAVVVQTAGGKVVHWWIEGGLPERSLPVYPTQLFSAVNAGLLFVVMWSFYPFRRRDGEVFALLLTLYPIGRFLLELIRDDVPGFAGTPLTISQWVSIAGFAGAMALWIYLARQPKETAYPKAAESSH